MDAGWKKTDETEDPDETDEPKDPDEPDVTDGAIGVLVSTSFKNLMLLMFFMRMENFLQFLN